MASSLSLCHSLRWFSQCLAVIGGVYHYRGSYLERVREAKGALEVVLLQRQSPNLLYLTAWPSALDIVYLPVYLYSLARL